MPNIGECQDREAGVGGFTSGLAWGFLGGGGEPGKRTTFEM